MLRLGKIAIICRDKRGIFMLDRNGVVERIKDVLPGFNGHLGGALHDGRIIMEWEFQRSKSLHIISGRGGRKSRQDRGDLGEPMRGLQYLYFSIND